jgi:GTPase SAR1 family protein
VLNADTFDRVNEIKKQLDKTLPKDKREVPIVLVGTMIDLPGRQVDTEMASVWASRERGE